MAPNKAVSKAKRTRRDSVPNASQKPPPKLSKTDAATKEPKPSKDKRKEEVSKLEEEFRQSKTPTPAKPSGNRPPSAVDERTQTDAQKAEMEKMKIAAAKARTKPSEVPIVDTDEDEEEEKQPAEVQVVEKPDEETKKKAGADRHGRPSPSPL